MRQLTLFVLLSLAVCFGVVAASSVAGGRSDRRLFPSVESESPVTLLPGYRHRSERGIDTNPGRIWKENGPSIDYDIGMLSGNLAEGYAQEFPNLPTIRLRTQSPCPFVVVMDEEHDAMIVSAFPGNFHAYHVKSRRDVAEVLTMLKTFEFKAQAQFGC